MLSYMMFQNLSWTNPYHCLCTDNASTLKISNKRLLYITLCKFFCKVLWYTCDHCNLNNWPVWASLSGILAILLILKWSEMNQVGKKKSKTIWVNSQLNVSWMWMHCLWYERTVSWMLVECECVCRWMEEWMVSGWNECDCAAWALCNTGWKLNCSLFSVATCYEICKSTTIECVRETRLKRERDQWERRETKERRQG